MSLFWQLRTIAAIAHAMGQQLHSNGCPVHHALEAITAVIASPFSMQCYEGLQSIVELLCFNSYIAFSLETWTMRWMQLSSAEATLQLWCNVVAQAKTL